MSSDDDDTSTTIKTSTDVFEIKDYTCVSSFERFIKDIEDYMLNNKDELSYKGYSYIIEQYDEKIQDNTALNMIAKECDLKFFILLRSISNNVMPIHQSLKCLSALTIACYQNLQLDSNIPIFVAVNDPYNYEYIGRTRDHLRYNIRHSKQLPHVSLQYLSGIIDYFEQHIKNVYHTRYKNELTDYIQIFSAVNLIYTEYTHNWDYLSLTNKAKSSSLLDLNESYLSEHCKWRSTSNDPFHTFWGPIKDPISSIQLTTSWPYFKSNTFVENAVYSDLNPLQAPNWSISIYYTRNNHFNDTPLAEALYKLKNIWSNSLSNHQSSNYDDSTSNNDQHTFMALRAVHLMKEATQTALYGESITIANAIDIIEYEIFAANEQTSSDSLELSNKSYIMDQSAPYKSLLSRLVYKMLDIHIEDHKLTQKVLKSYGINFLKKYVGIMSMINYYHI